MTRTFRNAISAGLPVVASVFLFAATLASILTGCLIVGGSDSDPAVVELQEGETRAIGGDGTMLTFVAELADSRCAIDVTCVTAGSAEIALRLDTDRGRFDFSLSGFLGPDGAQVGDPPGSTLIEHIAGYEIRLLRLDPYPDTRVADPSTPVAVLRVEDL